MCEKNVKVRQSVTDLSIVCTRELYDLDYNSPSDALPTSSGKCGSFIFAHNEDLWKWKSHYYI